MSDVKMTREEVLKLLNEMAPISDESYLKLAKLMAESECCFKHILGVDDDKLIRFVKNWVELVIFRVKDRACFSEHVTTAACLLKVLGAIDDDDLFEEQSTLTGDMVDYLYGLGEMKYPNFEVVEILKVMLVPHFQERCRSYISSLPRVLTKRRVDSAWDIYTRVRVLYSSMSSTTCVVNTGTMIACPKIGSSVPDTVDRANVDDQQEAIRGWMTDCLTFLEVLATA